ncbi:MAG: hypothetical protein HZA37_00905 [Parcubacteria group bacterium]|nr:hypothetical protein [Parcubacteria group bacterium]
MKKRRDKTEMVFIGINALMLLAMIGGFIFAAKFIVEKFNEVRVDSVEAPKVDKFDIEGFEKLKLAP